MQRRLAAVMVALVAACSGGAGPTEHPHPPHPPPADARAPVTAAPLTVRECDDLIAHAVQLEAAHRGSGSAAPTPAEVEAAAAQVRADLGVACADLPRAVYDCALAAGSHDALLACDRRPQR